MSEEGLPLNPNAYSQASSQLEVGHDGPSDQQIGLLAPACTTPGGLRRCSEDDLARVARIRELQTLLGLNLDEVAVVLRNQDRLAVSASPTMTRGPARWNAAG